MTQFSYGMKQVKRLKDQLQKETALRSLLLKASDQSHKIELSHTSSLPRSVCSYTASLTFMNLVICECFLIFRFKNFSPV